MSDGESPSLKKLKVDNMEASEEDIKDEVDIIDDMEASEKNIMDEYEERQYYNYTNFELSMVVLPNGFVRKFPSLSILKSMSLRLK